MANDPQTAAREILEIIPLVMRTLRTELAQPSDLRSPVHFSLLFMLTEGPHNLSELAQKANVTLPTMSRTVSTLAEHGLVQRTQSVEDRRRVDIRLTDAGRAQLDHVLHEAVLHLAEVLKGVSDADRKTLVDGLAVLRRAFS